MEFGAGNPKYSIANILGFDNDVFEEYLRLSVLTSTDGARISYVNLGKYLGWSWSWLVLIVALCSCSWFIVMPVVVIVVVAHVDGNSRG